MVFEVILSCLYHVAKVAVHPVNQSSFEDFELRDDIDLLRERRRFLR